MPTDAATSESSNLRLVPAGRRALSRRARLRIEVAWFSITQVVTGGALIVVLRLWQAHPHVPFHFGGDSHLNMMVIKNLLDGGWVNHTPHLGAPFGQRLYDYPVFTWDAVHLSLIKVMGLFTDDAALAINLFYVLTFFLTSATAYVVLRLLNVSPPLASAIAVLFSFLPYHFLRHQAHLMLGAYYLVPFSCFLVIRQLDDDPLFDVRGLRTDGLWSWLRRPGTTWAIAICPLLALGGLYYAFFTVLLLGFVGFVRSAGTRSLRPLLSCSILAGLVAATLVVVAVPNIAYWARNGSNPDVGRRTYVESELYALRIVNLVLPARDHRIPALRQRATTDQSPVRGEGSETLGAVGTAGFMGLLLVVFLRLFGLRRTHLGRFERMGGLLLFVLLTTTVAGFSSVVSVLGLKQIRGWNRFSVFVAFLALTAAALALDRVLTRPRWAASGLARLCAWLLLLVVGITDQTTGAFVPLYGKVADVWNTDRSFFRAVERRFGRADVFQLPYAGFPEQPSIVKMSYYEHLRGYLQSDLLRWSYGGVAGRESHWQDQVASGAISVAVPRLAIAGFEALYIDRFGYLDGGASLDEVLRPRLGEPLVSRDNRMVVYDLRPVRTVLEARFSAGQLEEARRLVTQPVELEWGRGFYHLEQGGTDAWRWAKSDARLTLVNRSARVRQVMLALQLDPGPKATPTVRIRGGGAHAVVPTLGRRVPVQLRLTLPPGRTTLAFASDAPRVPFAHEDPRDLRFQVLNLRLDEGALSDVPDLPAVVTIPGQPRALVTVRSSRLPAAATAGEARRW